MLLGDASSRDSRRNIDVMVRQWHGCRGPTLGHRWVDCESLPTEGMVDMRSTSPARLCPPGPPPLAGLSRDQSTLALARITWADQVLRSYGVLPLERGTVGARIRQGRRRQWGLVYTSARVDSPDLVESRGAGWPAARRPDRGKLDRCQRLKSRIRSRASHSGLDPDHTGGDAAKDGSICPPMGSGVSDRRPDSPVSQRRSRIHRSTSRQRCAGAKAVSHNASTPRAMWCGPPSTIRLTTTSSAPRWHNHLAQVVPETAAVQGGLEGTEADGLR